MRVGLHALIAGMALLATVVVCRAEPDIFVPSFVNPQHHVDRPDLGTDRTIRFLTTDDDPPFDFLAPDGTLAGYNVDLARALCNELKVTCSIQARPWASLVPTLEAKGGDAVIASLAMTERSRAEVDFSTPIMKTPARFAARTGTALTAVLPETVGKLAVGVQAGTAHAAYLAAFFPGAAVTTFTDPESLRAALKGGKIDLMFADGIATALWLNGSQAQGCCTFVGGPFTESRYFGDGTGIAVRKGDTTLRDAFDYALARLAANGTATDLYLKYFPISPY